MGRQYRGGGDATMAVRAVDDKAQADRETFPRRSSLSERSKDRGYRPQWPNAGSHCRRDPLPQSGHRSATTRRVPAVMGARGRKANRPAYVLRAERRRSKAGSTCPLYERTGRFTFMRRHGGEIRKPSTRNRPDLRSDGHALMLGRGPRMSAPSSKPDIIRRQRNMRSVPRAYPRQGVGCTITRRLSRGEMYGCRASHGDKRFRLQSAIIGPPILP